MIDKKLVLVVVPARGGSKGLELKNICLFNGVPLVTLVGQVVKQLTFVDRAVVSTDHPEIVRIAEESGLEVPFMRPEGISGDLISDWDVLNHALGAVEKDDKRSYDIVIMLQPTCPLRKPEHVRKAVDKLVEGNYDAVWTISETDSKSHPLKQLTFQADRLDYYDEEGSRIIARQQLEPVYHVNGAAYAITRQCLLGQRSKKGRLTSAVVITDPLISIDTEDDLKMAEFILSQNKR